MTEPTDEQKQKARAILDQWLEGPPLQMHARLIDAIATALAAEAAQPLDADIESYLREVEARADAATEGPWHAPALLQKSVLGIASASGGRLLHQLRRTRVGFARKRVLQSGRFKCQLVSEM